VRPEDEQAGHLPPPPTERQLPRQALHKANLLAALAAEPGQRQGIRRTPRRRWTSARGWLVPGFAAIAVTGVAVAALTLSLAVFGRSASPQPPSRDHNRLPGPAPAGELTRTRHWQVASAGLHGVVVRANVGAITVTGDGAGSPVAITARPVYRGAAPVVSSTVRGGVLTVSASCPRSTGTHHCMVTAVVTLPRSLPVRASMDIGSVNVNDMTARVTASDNLGDIRGHGLDSKRVTLAARVGLIDVSFSAPPDLVDATDQTGSIAITVPTSVSYRVNASARLGVVKVTVPQSASSAHVVTASAQIGGVSVTK
jgi:hypothetical protein